MELRERWSMYHKIQNLKALGLKVSQIARHLGVDRRTVSKYIDATPEEVHNMNESSKIRTKKLDFYKRETFNWLKKFPDLSSAQVYDWLKENFQVENVCEPTVGNYVRQLRKEYDIPKVVQKREYEAIEDPPMGHQIQVDFGEKSLKDFNGNWVKLRFITFVLSHSRYKYLEWLDRPYTTADVICAHENAFAFFGGIPREIVYDQDHLILVSENHGDLILTQEFTNYLRKRSFRIYMCRKGDPESKGKVENVVGYVKKNFAHNRTFYNLSKLNEQSLQWLTRTGNGKKHNTTKKIPAEVFLEEKKYLQPVTEKINILFDKPSITRTVRKDNTIIYKSNRYSLPLGTYKDKKENKVLLVKTENNTILLVDKETGEKLAEHPICFEKGKLVKNTNHGRDRSKGIQSYIKEVATLLDNTPQVQEFLNAIHTHKNRYIRDQLQLIKQNIASVDKQIIREALDYCLKNKLFSASEFSDALKHYQNLIKIPTDNTTATTCTDINPLHEVDRSKMKTKPEVRSINEYKKILCG
ncbi:IS21 family transposase [Desulfolucanica intricata]|uniref:IS21 family transposase n=1 Tax=Desulfolucanica intricata TaxID=1285191 RepID=UPI0008344EA1|nr:IS21 family transposase [Desulfolucanica intricata]